MRFSFFSLVAATVCLSAGAFAAAPSAAAASGASAAVAAERHSNSVAASAPSSLAAVHSAPAVQSSAAAVFVEKNDEIDEIDAETMETIQLGALEDVASLLVSLLAGILKLVIHVVLGGLGLSMTDAQVDQVQQEALEQIQNMGGVETLKETMRAGGLKNVIDFIINVVIPIIKKIKGAAGGGQ